MKASCISCRSFHIHILWSYHGRIALPLEIVANHSTSSAGNSWMDPLPQSSSFVHLQGTKHAAATVQAPYLSCWIHHCLSRRYNSSSYRLLPPHIISSRQGNFAIDLWGIFPPFCTRHHTSWWDHGSTHVQDWQVHTPALVWLRDERHRGRHAFYSRWKFLQSSVDLLPDHRFHWHGRHIHRDLVINTGTSPGV